MPEEQMDSYRLTEERLGTRLRRSEVEDICLRWGGDDRMRQRLVELSGCPDERTGYNALWVLSHLPAPYARLLAPMRNTLIDFLLATAHKGKKRLLLTLLERLTCCKEEARTDYLDFCLAGINSAEPPAIRALCLKQAFAQCRHYPELMAELKNEMEMMELGDMPPGLASARRIVQRRNKTLKTWRNWDNR